MFLLYNIVHELDDMVSRQNHQRLKLFRTVHFLEVRAKPYKFLSSRLGKVVLSEAGPLISHYNNINTSKKN